MAVRTLERRLLLGIAAFCLLLLRAQVANGDEEADGRRLASSVPTCDIGSAEPVELGGQMRLCVFLSASPPKKMVFQISVDEYAALTLKGAGNHISLSSSVYTWVAASHAEAAYALDCSNSSDVEERLHLVSCPQVYSTPSNVAQIASLVVNLEDGRISSFAWDNSCAGCGPDSCVHSSKGLNRTTYEEEGGSFSQGTCAASSSGCSGESCDLKVFVTWAGTDKNGRHAKTAGMRLSKFTGYTLGSLYEKAASYGQVLSR